MADPRVVLGLDVGGKRIGVARGSSAARLATPLAVVQADGTEVEQILRLVEQEGAGEVVVGLPRSLDGQETSQTATTRAFAQRLEEQGIFVIFQDEAATTIQAEHEQFGRGKPSQIDAHAAAIILQDYLDGLK